MGQFEDSAKQGWGVWRKFISANPLTGSWISFGAGAGIVLAFWHFFG